MVFKVQPAEPVAFPLEALDQVAADKAASAINQDAFSHFPSAQKSVSAVAEEDGAGGTRKDVEVQPEGPVADVVRV